MSQQYNSVIQHSLNLVEFFKENSIYLHKKICHKFELFRSEPF